MDPGCLGNDHCQRLNEGGWQSSYPGVISFEAKQPVPPQSQSRVGKAGEVDDGGFDWVKVGEERPTELAIRPPHELVGSNAALLAHATAVGVTWKRPRTDSVPVVGI
jgi:hypothetical protein